MHSDREREILQACVNRLEALEPIQAVSVRPESLPAHGVRERLFAPDGILILHTEFGSADYALEITKGLTPQKLDHFLVRLSGDRADKLLLVADYVAPPMAQRLAKAGIDFVDTAGNVHLHRPGRLYVSVQGRKAPTPSDRRPTRLFQPSGLQVLFVLLSKPSHAALPYRNLAALGGVSLGTVSRVASELRQKGYLIQTGPKEWALVRQEELLEQWVTGYTERLRAKLLIDRFRASDNDLDHVITSLGNSSVGHPGMWALTGGWAADALTHHYRGDQLVVFVKGWSHASLRELEWLPSPEGPITLLRLFSPAALLDANPKDSHPVAHPLLVYAELLFQGSERDLETARIIYDQYLRPLVT